MLRMRQWPIWVSTAMVGMLSVVVIDLALSFR
jgi:hypothetical protein